jgi:hypothetical protein
MVSIERQLENRFISVIGSITGVSVWNADRWADKEYYGVSGGVVVAATDLGKELTPGAGVFEVGVKIEFAAKIHDQNAVSHSEVWEQIRQQLYFDSTLESRLTTGGFTVYGVVKDGETAETDNDQLMWKKTMSMKVWVTPR